MIQIITATTGESNTQKEMNNGIKDTREYIIQSTYMVNTTSIKQW